MKSLPKLALVLATTNMVFDLPVLAQASNWQVVYSEPRNLTSSDPDDVKRALLEIDTNSIRTVSGTTFWVLRSTYFRVDGQHEQYVNQWQAICPERKYRYPGSDFKRLDDHRRPDLIIKNSAWSWVC